MNTKLKEEGFQSSSHSMPCSHIDEKSCQVVDANIEKYLWLEGKLIHWVSMVIKANFSLNCNCNINPTK
jgi:hypothetical protein